MRPAKIQGNDMEAVILGSLGDVDKGEPGKSAYEIAVEHGYEGTEEEWLAYVQANADVAVSASTAAQEAQARAEYASDEAQGHAESASTSSKVAHNEAESAADSAARAEAAAVSAGGSRDSAALLATAAADSATDAAASATEAANQALLATGRADEARQSQIDAHVSEVHVEEMYVDIMQAPVVVEEQTRRAIASAEAAAQSATAAAGSATAAAGSATNSAGSAESSATAATAAEAAALRAESAMQTVIGSLADYYDKEQVDSIVAGIPRLQREIVSALPTTDIDEDTIYMIQDGSVSGNAYAEYMYINGQWEAIGTTETELADYEKKADIAPYKAKLDSIEAGAQVNTVTGVKGSDELVFRTGDISISKADIGLGNVDNTADSIKSVAAASVATAASCLDNVDLSANYAQGDVVFVDDLNPSSCLVCVSVPGGSTP